MKTELKHFSATSPGLLGRTVKVWDSFQAEVIQPGVILYSKLERWGHWRVQQSCRDSTGQVNRNSKCSYKVLPPFHFLKAPPSHAQGKPPFLAQAILSTISYVSCPGSPFGSSCYYISHYAFMAERSEIHICHIYWHSYYLCHCLSWLSYCFLSSWLKRMKK